MCQHNDIQSETRVHGLLPATSSPSEFDFTYFNNYKVEIIYWYDIERKNGGGENDYNDVMTMMTLLCYFKKIYSSTIIHYSTPPRLPPKLACIRKNVFCACSSIPRNSVRIGPNDSKCKFATPPV